MILMRDRYTTISRYGSKIIVQSFKSEDRLDYAVSSFIAKNYHRVIFYCIAKENNNA